MAMNPTLVPFASLPKCALDCGHLYDANGACVPPAKPTADVGTYAACFCADSRVAPFSTGTAGVCDAACTAPADQGGLASIQSWFTGYCSTVAKQAAATPGATGSATATGNNGSGGDWLSSHWQWVIFIVIVVVGIAGIWIGACVWRRHYLRRKDRQYALGKSLAAQQGGGNGAAGPGQSQRSVHLPQAGFFAPASISTANVYDVEKPATAAPKKARKKWIVTQRT